MKYISSILKLVVLISASLVGYGIHADTNKQKNFLSPISSIQLGGGFLREAKLPIMNKCLKSEDMIVSDFKKDIQFHKAVNSDLQAKTLNLDLKAKAGWGKFAVSGELDYINQIKSNDYSLAFSYQSTISGNVSLNTLGAYGVDALYPGAAAAYNASPDNFLAKCGDSYIKQIRMGAILDVTMLIHFSSVNQKKQFEASLEGKVGDIWSASAKLQQEMQKNNYSGNIEILAFQAGGNPTHLDEIFGLDSEHDIVRCNLQNLEACTKAIDNVINYAQASGKWSETGFAKQVQVKERKLKADSLYPMNLSNGNFGSYSQDFGLETKDVVASPETINARKKLNKLYDEQERKLVVAQHITDSRAFSYLHPKVQKPLINSYEDLSGNLYDFYDGRALSCFLPASQNQCSKIVADIESSLTPVDFEPFDMLSRSYFVNIDYRWPSIFVMQASGNMKVYDSNLMVKQIRSENLQIIPSSNFDYVAIGGWYSSLNETKNVRYYLGYYKNENRVQKSNTGIGYEGNPPWRICVNNECYKASTHMTIIPF